jgi:hypothetical protein
MEVSGQLHISLATEEESLVSTEQEAGSIARTVWKVWREGTPLVPARN